MTQSPEERKEKQKVAQKNYRDRMTPEQKEKVAQSKRASADKRKEKTVVERKLYYEKNKAAMNAQSKAYHQKKREELAELKAQGLYKHITPLPKPRKVMHQPADMIMPKEIAKLLGISTSHFRSMQKDPRFNVPEYKLLRADGIELYVTFEIHDWQQKYRDMIAQETIAGVLRNNAEIRLDPKLMLVINWLQETQHVTKYCDTQRVAINSNRYWARWA